MADPDVSHLVVLPEGTQRPERPRAGVGRSSLSLLAGAGLLVGFLLLGSLTTPEPEAVPPSSSTTTTTTEPIEPPLDLENFSVSQISRGEPFEWEQTLTVEDASPTALLEHENWVYLFASDSLPYFGSGAGGVHGWRTTNGASWESLGEVIPEPNVITQVASTSLGLLAVGWDKTSNGVSVWLSNNGSDWTAEELPVEGIEPFMTVYPTAAGGSDNLLVVTGQTQFNTYERIEEKLGSVDGFDPTRYGLGIDVIGEEVQVTLYGPLGLSLGSMSAEDLDLTTEEIEVLIAEHRGAGGEGIAWMKTDDAAWEQSEIPEVSWVESIYVTPEDEVVVFGYGESGGSRWASTDGVNWERVISMRAPYRVERWGTRLIGPSDTGGAGVLVSDEDGSWEDIGPGNLFPRELGWHTEGIGAGPGGIATMIRGWDDRGFREAERVDPVMVTSNGSTLTLDLDEGSYDLTTPDGSAHHWSMFSQTQEGVVPDLETGTISFHDPHNGDLLASFAIDAIVDAENEYYAQYAESERTDNYLAFAFTADGNEWTIQDETTTWNDVAPALLEVTDTHVFAADFTTTAFYDPETLPNFGVWAAAIP
jgi:hypothetical protein